MPAGGQAPDHRRAAVAAATHHGRVAAGGETAPAADVDVDAALNVLTDDACVAWSTRDAVAPAVGAMLRAARDAELTNAVRARHGDVGGDMPLDGLALALRSAAPAK